MSDSGKPTSSGRGTLIALLMVVALIVVALVKLWPNRDSEPAVSSPEAVGPERPVGRERPSNWQSEKPGVPGRGEELETLETGGEIDSFLSDYGRLRDVDEKVDRLTEVRSLDPPDHPAIVRLLLSEVFDADPIVRESAREALAEYGGVTAQRELESLLAARPDAPERHELESVLDFIGTPGIDSLR